MLGLHQLVVRRLSGRDSVQLASHLDQRTDSTGEIGRHRGDGNHGGALSVSFQSDLGALTGEPPPGIAHGRTQNDGQTLTSAARYVNQCGCTLGIGSHRCSRTDDQGQVPRVTAFGPPDLPIGSTINAGEKRLPLADTSLAFGDDISYRWDVGDPLKRFQLPIETNQSEFNLVGPPGCRHFDSDCSHDRRGARSGHIERRGLLQIDQDEA